MNGNGDEDGGAYDGTELKNNASSAKPLSWLLSSSSDSDSYIDILRDWLLVGPAGDEKTSSTESRVTTWCFKGDGMEALCCIVEGLPGVVRWGAAGRDVRFPGLRAGKSECADEGNMVVGKQGRVR